jgi:hypothetical protein
MVRVGPTPISEQPAPQEPKEKVAHPLTGKMKESVPPPAGTPRNILLTKRITVGAPEGAPSLVAIRTKLVIPFGKPIEESEDVIGLESMRFLFINAGDIKTKEVATKRAIEFADNGFNIHIPEKSRTQILRPVVTPEGVHLESQLLDSKEALAGVKRGILHDPSTGKVAVPKKLYEEFGNFLLRMVEESCKANQIPTDPDYKEGETLPNMHLEVIDEETGIQKVFEDVLTHEVEQNVMARANLQRIAQQEAHKGHAHEGKSPSSFHATGKAPELVGGKHKAEVKPHQEAPHPKRQAVTLAKQEQAAFAHEAKALKEEKEIIEKADATRRKEDAKAESRTEKHRKAT